VKADSYVLLSLEHLNKNCFGILPTKMW